MKKKYATILLVLIIISTACTQSKERSINEKTEWSHTWMVNTSDTVLPRVLVVGDSHVERYYPHIALSLKDQANVCKLTTSKSLGDPILLDQIQMLLKQYNFNIITFNNGLHGRGYAEKEYADHLPLLVNMIKENCEGILILVNTTPARQSNNLDNFQEFNKKVIERNQIFENFAKEHSLLLVNLYTLGEKSSDYYTNDGIHFNEKGVREEARLVSEKIKMYIN
ncbi:MAG: SGNH/GDSL hydrolase family protein [Bacteroidales bacterium]|nr:SGNH/GDSL hydrolase family protein [Bacteroidales bacterium]